MDRATLITALRAALNKVPTYVANADIKSVREFKTWHTKAVKQMSSSNTSVTGLLGLLREVESRYSTANK